MSAMTDSVRQITQSMNSKYIFKNQFYIQGKGRERPDSSEGGALELFYLFLILIFYRNIPKIIIHKCIKK